MKNKRTFCRKLFVVLVAFAMLAGNLNLAAVFNQARADSAPLAISVSSGFSGAPLLGGTATISVTITNTGDERGYNVSLEQLISAEPGFPGTVSFVSATVGGDSLPPSAVFSDSQGLHLSFDNFTDLEPSESVTIRVTVQLDDEWSVGDLVVAESLARVNTMPDDTGVWIEESMSAQAEVIPIMVVSKSSQQSTGVEQATGTEDRVYRYSISVQNNYLEETNDVSLVDALPDGLEFLGIVGVWLNGVPVDPDDYPFVFDRDSASGVTDLSWQIGDMDPGDNWRVEFESAVRYDYYGTDNGGTNRVHNDFTEEDWGTPVPNKTPFENTAELSAWFQGEEYTDSDTARITGAYATIEKGVSPGTVGNGTIVTYTITFYTSEYYSLDDIVITDILPDGQTYIDGSASIEPDSVEEHADGTTTLIWDTLEEPVNPSASRTITFQAVVDEQWVAPPFDRENIVSGDRMTNQVDLSAQWTDQVDDDRPGGITGTTASGSSAGVSTGRPRIEKQVSFDGVEWVDDIELTVGDVVYFRMRFNTTDGTTPYRSDIRFGDISMVDWLPRGMMYLDGTYTLNYAGGAGIFISPGSEYDDPPQQVTIGDLDGLSWWLGDIEKGGWWEVTFQAEVVDIPLVAQGVRVANHAKMAGENSFLRRYSDRDVVDIDYIEPSLTLGKTTTENKHWVPGEDIEYELVIENTGGATAWNLQVTDILPVGMREFDPSIDNYSVEIDSVALTPNDDYIVAYDQLSGTMTWTFLVPVESDSIVTIVYNAQVDDGIAAGTELDNLATAAWNSQDVGGRHYPGSGDPADDNTDDHRIRVRDLEIVKTGPAGPVTIGDRLDYSVQLVVPAGTVAYWPEIQDRFNAYGVDYVAGSAELQFVSGGPVTPAVLVDATPSISSGPQGRIFSWLLENYIDNSGSAADYVFRLVYQVDLTGEDGASWEYWIPADNHQLLNTAEVRWNTINSAERATNRSEDDNDAVAVIQPYLLLDKKVVTPGPYRGGDVVEYHITIVNDGYYDAHNVIVVDNLPPGLASTGLVAQINGLPLDPSEYVYVAVGSTVTVTIDAPLAVGEELTLIHTTTIDGNIGSGAKLTNLVSVEYTTQADGSGRHVVRTTDTADVNTDDETIDVERVTISKAISGPNPATIGDEVEYILTITVPGETVAYLPYLQDVVDVDGMEYVTGSTALAGTDLSGITFRSTPEPVIVQTSPGLSLLWEFNAIDNTGTDEDLVFELRFRLRVTGVAPGDDNIPDNWLWWVPGASDQVNDQATFSWHIEDDPDSTLLSDTSDELTTDIQQPYLTLDKTRNVSTVRGGDTIRYTVTIDNTGQSAAHRVVVIDDLPLGLGIDDVSTDVTVTLAGVPLTQGVDYTVSFDSVTRRLTVDLDSTPVPVGAALIVEYDALVVGGIGAGSTLTNIASVEYSSRVDDPARTIVHTDDPADDNTDSTTVNVVNATIGKTIIGPNPATIGDEVEYVLTVTVPAGTFAYIPDVADILFHKGMSYVAGSAYLSVDPGGIVFTSGSPEPVIIQTAAGMRLEWNLETIDNTDPYDQNLTFEIRFRLLVTGEDASADWLWWPPGTDDQVRDRGRFRWYIEDSTSSARRTQQSPNRFTDIDQPYLTLFKADTTAAGPYRGGDTITYTLTTTNSGQWPAHRVVVIDDLPLGLGIDDVATDVTVTLAGAPLTQGVDYTVSFDSVTRRLTVDLDSTPVPVGAVLIVEYDALVVGGIGAGSTLTNIASVEYSSRADDPARTIVHTDDPADINTDDETVEVAEASIRKSIDGPNPATIGDEVEYVLTVTIPAGTMAYFPAITDVVDVDGMEYVDSELIVVSGAAVVSFANPGDPVAIVQNNPGMTLTWVLDTIDNSDPYDTDLVFELRFRLRVTGVAPGDDNIPDNWLWWPPGISDQVNDQGTFSWRLEDDPDSTLLSDTSSQLATDIHQPYLTLVKGNDAVGTLAGGDQVIYTLLIVNSGQSAAHRLNILDTLPQGVVDVTVNFLFLGGAPLAPADYSVLWNPAANLLTIDIIPGLGASQDLLVFYTATLGDVMPSGSILTNIASVAYNSQGDGSGRQVELSLDVDDANTDDSTFSITRAEIEKSHDAVGNQATIGEEFTYTIQVTIPADTVIYNAKVTDTIADGLAVLGTSTAVGTISVVPQPGGSTLVTWDIGNYVNDTDNPVTLELTIDVRVLKQFADSTPVSGLLPAPDDFSNLAVLAWEDASVGGDSYSDSDTAQPITVVEPVLVVTKGWENLTHPGQQPEAGDVLLYTITVENQGTSAAYQVGVSDPLSGWVTYIPGTITGPGADDSDPDDLAWDIGTMTTGEELTLQYRVEINAGISWGQNLDNTATLQEHYSLPQPNGHAREYDASEATAPATARAAGLVVDKSVVGSNTVRWGEVILYRVTITNVGDAAAYDVNMTDNIAHPHIQYIPGSTSIVWPDGSSTDDPAGVGTATLEWIVNAQIGPGQSLVLDYQAQSPVGTDYDWYTNTISAGGTDGGGTTVPGDSGIPGDTDPDDLDSESVLVSNPDIVVTKAFASVNEYIPVGNTLTYTIRVENTGNTTIPIVPLADTFSAAHLAFANILAGPSEDSFDNTTGVVNWSDITGGAGLAPGESVELTVEFTALAVGSTPDTDNTASVSTDDEHGNPVSDSATDDTLIITDPDITVTKAFAGANEYIPVGNTLTYTIRVENTGNTAIPVVPLVDTFNAAYLSYVTAGILPDTIATGSLSWNDITEGDGLAPGEFVELTVEFTALAVGSTPDTDNTASVSTDDEHGNPVSDSDTDDSLTITNPGVIVNKELALGQPGTVLVGESVVFHITITNNGNTDLVEIPLDDAFDSAVLEFLTSSLLPSNIGDSLVQWDDILAAAGLDKLEPGETIGLLVTLRALDVTPATVNNVGVSGAVDEHGNNPPDAEDSEMVEVIPNSDGLSVEKVSDPPHNTPVLPGDTITFTVVVENLLDVPLYSITIEDYIEPAAEFVPGSLELNGVALDDSHYDEDTRLVTVQIDTLLPGETATLVFQVEVAEYDKAVPDVVNVATVDSPQTGVIESDPPVVLPVDPFILIKEVTNISGEGLNPGDILEWVITVRNIGHAPTVNIIVTDEIPEFTVYVEGSIGGPGADDSTPGVLVWNVGSLDVGEEAVLVFRTRVNDDLESGLVIANQAFLTSDQIVEEKPSSGPEGLHTPTTITVMPRTGTNIMYFWYGGLLLLIIGLGGLAFGFLRKEE